MENLKSIIIKVENQRYLYRFRAGKYLFDELENHEIYFAPMDALNDPMEGFKEVFWEGDEIAWKSLFKHYLLCLLQSLSFTIVARENFSSFDSKIRVFETPYNLQFENLKPVYNDAWEYFYSNADIVNLIDKLSKPNKKVSRNELFFYLQVLHYDFLNAIIKQLQYKSLIPDEPWNTILNNAKKGDNVLTTDYFDIFGEEESPNVIQDFVSHHFKSILEEDLLDIDVLNQNFNLKFIFIEYPEQYLNELDTVIHRKSHTVCFSSTYEKASMWSYYACNHEGICLKFEVKEPKPEKYEFPLYSSNQKYKNQKQIKNVSNHKFYKVNYSSQLPEINFFHSIGLMTTADLREFWFKDGNNESICAKYIFDSEQDWLDKYFSEYYSTVTTKLLDWEHEEEYRLILTDTLNQFKKGEGRKLRYTSNSLVGIIFGIRTSLEEKRRILSILRNEFDMESLKQIKIYQAYYENHAGKVSCHELEEVSSSLTT